MTNFLGRCWILLNVMNSYWWNKGNNCHNLLVLFLSCISQSFTKERDSEIPKKGVNIISRYRDQMAHCEMQSFSEHRRSEKNCGHGFSDSFDVILDEPIFGWLLRNQMFE